MTATDWLIIAAILLGPAIALAMTRHLDRRAAWIAYIVGIR